MRNNINEFEPYHDLGVAIQTRAAQDYLETLNKIMFDPDARTFKYYIRKARSLYDFMGSEYWSQLSDVDGIIVRKAIIKQAKKQRRRFTIGKRGD